MLLADRDDLVGPAAFAKPGIQIEMFELLITSLVVIFVGGLVALMQQFLQRRHSKKAAE